MGDEDGGVRGAEGLDARGGVGEVDGGEGGVEVVGGVECGCVLDTGTEEVCEHAMCRHVSHLTS